MNKFSDLQNSVFNKKKLEIRIIGGQPPMVFGRLSGEEDVDSVTQKKTVINVKNFCDN